jgi:hypothetical protein
VCVLAIATGGALTVVAADPESALAAQSAAAVTLVMAAAPSPAEAAWHRMRSDLAERMVSDRYLIILADPFVTSREIGGDGRWARADGFIACQIHRLEPAIGRASEIPRRVGLGVIR